MSYLKTRKPNMEKLLANLIARNSSKLAVAYAFANNNIYIYRFQENRYSSSLLNNTKWSQEAILDFLTWEELNQILNNVEFIEKNQLSSWIKSKQKCALIKLKFKIKSILKLT